MSRLAFFNIVRCLRARPLAIADQALIGLFFPVLTQVFNHDTLRRYLLRL